MTLTRFGYTASSIWDAPVFPDTCNPSQAVGSGEQEEHCLPRVFRSRELNKEQEKGKWLLWCLHLPLFSPPPKKKKLKFDFPEAAPKEITWHSKEKAYLFFFPTYRLGYKSSLSARGKNPILFARAHCCQTDGPTWARAASRSETGQE